MDTKKKKTLLSISFLAFLYVVIIESGLIPSDEHRSATYDYAVTLSFIIPMIIGIFLKGRVIIPKNKESLIAGSLVALWIYGILLGLYLGNNVSYIFTNFAGMSLYILFFILYNSRLSVNKTEKALLAISYFTVYITLLCYLDRFVLFTNVFENIPYFNTGYNSSGISYGSKYLIFINLAYCLYNLFIIKKVKLQYIISICVALFDVLLATDSGGDALAAIFLLSVVFFGFPVATKKGKQRFQYLLLGFGTYLFL